MPMMIPPGQGVTTTTPAGQVTTPGPSQAPQATAQPQQAPRVPSPFKQEIPPDLVIMPHLDSPSAAPGNPPKPT